MALLSFELTMPNRGSWNGQWSGSDKKYFIIKKISQRYLNKSEHLKTIADKGYDDFYYRWDDGWGANVRVEIIDGIESRKRRKQSKGFAGYEWMIDSIIYYGDIMTTDERRKHMVNTGIV